MVPLLMPLSKRILCRHSRTAPKPYSVYISMYFFFVWRCGPTRAMAASFLRFLDDTQQRITVGRTPLGEWSARRRDLYLTTHNTQQQKNIHAPGGIRTHDLSRRAATDRRLRPRGHCDRHTVYITYAVRI